MIEKNIFSVDVEDWFHILDLSSTPGLGEWSSLPSRVEKNLVGLLELFADCHARVTCFFLGWIAERYPHLVRMAVAAGHEVASHGYAHELVYRMTPEQFAQDISVARKLLQDVSGQPVIGYRAPGFSTTAAIPWYFEQVAAAGYKYDSSVFPARRRHGGWTGAERAPHRITTPSGLLTEFPISVVDLAGLPVCFFGGGYFRLFPYPVIRHMAGKVARAGRPVVFYIHPREIDPQQPRLPMSRYLSFKTYCRLDTTHSKLKRLLSEFPVTSFDDFLQSTQLAELVCPEDVIA